MVVHVHAKRVRINMKIRIIAIIVLVSLALSGCSSIEDLIEHRVLMESGIEDDPDYQDYLFYSENNRTDAEGYLLFSEGEESIESNEEEKGTVRITLGKNNNLLITYYYDAHLTQEITGNVCYLNPGDSLYASEPIIRNVSTNKYVFDKYQIYEEKEDGKVLIEESVGNGFLVYTVPSDFTGTDLSILPLGKLTNRHLSLETILIDEKGEKKASGIGTWWVNGSIVQDCETDISPVVSYRVEYDISNDEEISDLYYIDPGRSSSEISFVDIDRVRFFEQDSASDVERFSVALRRYTTLTIKNEKTNLTTRGLVKLTINGKEIENGKPSYTEQLKNGDEITVIIRKDSIITPDTSQDGFAISEPIEVEEGMQYLITIDSELDYSPIITISKKTANQGEHQSVSVPNGKVNLVKKSDGTVITTGDIIDDNERVILTISPNKGYYISGTGVKDGVFTRTLSYKKYCAQIETIIQSHPITKYIVMNLETDDEYGVVEYSIGFSKVEGTVSLKEGQSLIITYSLSDPDMEIVKEKGMSTNIITGGVSRGVTATRDLDGTTIRREQYIHLRKKGD